MFSNSWNYPVIIIIVNCKKSNESEQMNTQKGRKKSCNFPSENFSSKQARHNIMNGMKNFFCLNIIISSSVFCLILRISSGRMEKSCKKFSWDCHFDIVHAVYMFHNLVEMFEMSKGKCWHKKFSRCHNFLCRFLYLCRIHVSMMMMLTFFFQR